ncbi:MAG: hypothetical protein ABEJ84_08380 [Halodesulfurarchaeum sp.]
MSGLTVYLNRDGMNTVETDQTAVSATEAVDIALENHGKPTHVHLHLDDDLALLGSIEDPHWFVPAGERRELHLELTPAGEGRGRLDIAAGYGQEQTSVEVEVEPVEDAAGTESIDVVGGPAPQDPIAESDGERASPPRGIDTDRLRNPIVLATLGGFVIMLILLLFVNPLASIAAGMAAILGGIAVWSYVTDWDPLTVEGENS